MKVQLVTIDWILIAVYFVFSLGIALWFSKKSGKSLQDFFLGGRSLPWYIAGISMVATTFAADTPLAVNELVYKQGISGNWIWWNFLIGGMLTTFFFAKLWRRANVLTEVEFITLRYGGQLAGFLRSFKALYLGLLMNVLIMGWVNLALMSLLEGFFGLSAESAWWYTGAAMLIVAVYSSIGGFMSVAITDIFQFAIAMTGSIVLAVLVLNSDEIGGMSGLQDKLGPDNPVWDFFPTIGEQSAAGALVVTLATFLWFIGFQWWASWYPGAEPGGGGYVAQRMMSARSERDAVYATLFMQIAHYCLRPWPWIIVGLCTLVLYPELDAGEAKMGYVYAMGEFLPDGLRGLMLVSFLAAYMSTISTQLNWGASYIVNDFAKPMLERQNPGKEASQKQLVMSGRLTTLVLMIVAFFVSAQITSITAVWEFMVQCGAGLGLVLILRWFVPRINVWSEITATVMPFVVYGILMVMKYFFAVYNADGELVSWWAQSPGTLYITVGMTTLAWVLVTMVTPPESDETLERFYRQVRPGGGWAGFARRKGLQISQTNFGALGIAWLSAVGMTYCALFASGKLIFGETGVGLGLAVAAVALAVVCVIFIRKYDLFGSDTGSGDQG